MKSFVADFILALHFVWAAWMVSGVILAVAGFHWQELWRWRIFRISHLIGVLGTASVPIWAGGICPLTEWEWQLRTAGGSRPLQDSGSFIIDWMSDVLFIDMDPLILSLAAAFGALLTVVIFVWHPPRGR